MTASWERLAEATDGRYTRADFERAAYQLLVEQVVYAADRGSATPYHLLVTYAAAFKDVFDRLGVTLQHNHHHNYVVALARHRVAHACGCRKHGWRWCFVDSTTTPSTGRT